MALDSADKRSSAIHPTLPWRGMYPAPDAAAENQADRQHALGLYRGILATVVQAPGVFGDLTTLFVGYVADLHDAHLTEPDSNTLVRDDLATVRAASSNLDDANTMYAAHLS